MYMAAHSVPTSFGRDCLGETLVTSRRVVTDFFFFFTYYLTVRLTYVVYDIIYVHTQSRLTTGSQTSPVTAIFRTRVHGPKK